MGKLDMDGPFDLKSGVIDDKISTKQIGNYALGFLNGKGQFVVKAVGRSDKDLNREIKAAGRRYSSGLLARITVRRRPDKFKFSIADNPQSAYQVEQRSFENFGGSRKLLNKKAPTPPK